MNKAAIVDDNEIFLRTINSILEVSFDKYRINCSISAFSTGSDFLKAHSENYYDIVFLDIAMPEMNGFEVAKEVRKVSEKTYIIFITTESGLVYDSLDFRPFHFIPKASEDKLKSRIDHVVEKLSLHISANKPLQIDLPYGEKKFISPDDVIFVRSHSVYIDYHTSTGEIITVRNNMLDAQEQLSPHLFTRVHNRCIVNMRHIKRVDYPNSEIKLDNGDVIEISRTYRKIFENDYNLYLRDFS